MLDIRRNPVDYRKSLIVLLQRLSLRKTCRYSIKALYNVHIIEMGMLGRKDQYEKEFERLDKIEAEVTRLRRLGIEPKILSDFSQIYRRTMYALNGLTANTMLEVLKSGDERDLAEWNEMWNAIQQNKIHPREVKAFHDRLLKRNRSC